VVIIVDRMCICMGLAAPALEVFAADETSIDVEVEC
jgi:hypothetical protein